MQESALIRVMLQAARAAEKGLMRDFGEVENLQVSKKGPADFVTNADQRAEEMIFESLSKARPGYGFLMEERGTVEGSDSSHRFIVDPLDGTLNFMHGIPHFAVSIALEREGELYAGLVYNVAQNEVYWAEKGKGAWLNGKRLRVAARNKLREAILATGIPFHGRPGHVQCAREIETLAPEVAGIRRFGSAALDLAYVAAGRFDGFWERGLNAWDIAAGLVLVREAGGISRALEGRDALETGSVLVANLDLLPQIENRLASIKPLTGVEG